MATTVKKNLHAPRTLVRLLRNRIQESKSELCVSPFATAPRPVIMQRQLGYFPPYTHQNAPENFSKFQLEAPFTTQQSTPGHTKQQPQQGEVQSFSAYAERKRYSGAASTNIMDNKYAGQCLGSVQLKFRYCQIH